MDKALLHLDPVTSELLGVWIERDPYLEEYYPSGEDSDEHIYGEGLVTSAPWRSQLETLPEVSPYLARWAVVDRKPNETASLVFDRVSREAR